MSYDFPLDHRLAADLVKMSPLSWGRDAKQPSQEDIDELKKVHVSVDILIGKKSEEK